MSDGYVVGVGRGVGSALGGARFEAQVKGRMKQHPGVETLRLKRRSANHKPNSS